MRVSFENYQTHMLTKILQSIFRRARVVRIVSTFIGTKDNNLRGKFAPPLFPFLDDVDISNATTSAALKILSVNF